MWNLSFLAIIWLLWKERNARCFEGVESSTESLIIEKKFLVANWASVNTLFHGLPVDQRYVQLEGCCLFLTGFLDCCCSWVAGDGPLPVVFVLLVFPSLCFWLGVVSMSV